MAQQLGTYVFDFDPDIIDIPETKKIVSSVDTYGGGAIFEWAAILQGTIVELKWKWMHKLQYDRLRTLYLATGEEYDWVTGMDGRVLSVVIEDLKGTYLESILHGVNDAAIRSNVVLTLNIRSETSAESSSSSDSSSVSSSSGSSSSDSSSSGSSSSDSSSSESSSESSSSESSSESSSSESSSESSSSSESV